VNRKLLPVVVAQKSKADKKNPGSLVYYRALVAADDTEICKDDLPIEWLEYMKQSMNDYPFVRDRFVDSKLLAALEIPGEPLPSRAAVELAKLKRQRRELLSQPLELPIKKRIGLCCVFYMKPADQEYSLHELCNGTIEDMITIGILPDQEISNVISLDGSKIVHCTEPKTVIFIRG